MKYDDLIFGTFSQQEVLAAVRDSQWQDFRISLLTLPTKEKLQRLRHYARTHTSRADRIRVTNYVYALKRGGLLK